MMLSSHVGVGDKSWRSVHVAVADIYISATATLDDILSSHIGVADIDLGGYPLLQFQIYPGGHPMLQLQIDSGCKDTALTTIHFLS